MCKEALRWMGANSVDASTSNGYGERPKVIRDICTKNYILMSEVKTHELSSQGKIPW